MGNDPNKAPGRVELFLSRILRQEEIADGWYEIAFAWEAPPPRAGQFFTLTIQEGPHPLLRRPFAFSGYRPGEISAIYEVRGAVTSALSQARRHAHVELLGPLGNSFFDFPLQGSPVLVAGGIGLGPILFLATTLTSRGISPLLIIGCRHKRKVPHATSLSGFDVVVCTEDGSLGFSGTATDYLNTLSWNTLTTLYGCGPEGMLRACHFFAEAKKLPCFVSMEQIMGCALGACMGCVISLKAASSYARVCTEGPIFPSEDLLWN